MPRFVVGYPRGLKGWRFVAVIEAEDMGRALTEAQKLWPDCGVMPERAARRRPIATTQAVESKQA